MDTTFLKITYHLEGKKINAYIKSPSPVYHFLKKELEIYLFHERGQTQCEIRTFWIDEDNDQIEIVNQCDYEVFMAKTDKSRQHLQVTPIGVEVEKPDTSTKNMSVDSSSNQTTITPDDCSYDFAVHNHVECDSCLMSPIIGFRYKCIQCPNYDLCQNCESKQNHSEHMMVRMPTNNCPNVVEAYVTGRMSRKHDKRSKTACSFVKNGISTVIDDEGVTTSAAAGENVEQPSSSNGKERRHGRKHHRRQRNNFFSHLCEIMNDLAEGGGADAAAHAMGESATTSELPTSNNGPQTPSSNSKTKGFEKEGNQLAANVAAAAANVAAQFANNAATKAAEIADKVAQETAKNISEKFTNLPSASTTSDAPAAPQEENNEINKEKANVTETAPEVGPQANTAPDMPSPSLEDLVQYLDPQYMKTGIRILNNFSDMFAKMLDDGGEPTSNQTNLEENSFASNNSTISSNLNSFGAEKKLEEEKLMDNNPNQKTEEKQTTSDPTANVVIDDLGSESENDSGAESFVKLNVPKNNEEQFIITSVESTPPKSLDKSNVLDFAQLSADLKYHIAQEDKEEAPKTIENAKDTTNNSTTSINESVTVTNTASNKTTNDAPNKPEEKREIRVYHIDSRINNAVHAMISMGFSNEGAFLTQLLESVDGNIPNALDIMYTAQRNNSG